MGDDCLRAIATTLAKVAEQVNARRLARDAFAARYGGEEFAIMLPRCSAEALGEIARATVEARLAHPDWKVEIVVTAVL